MQEAVVYHELVLDSQPLLIHLHAYTQLPLEAKYKKALECEFHSSDYHMLTEMTSGLRNATEHLVKVQHIRLTYSTAFQVTLQTIFFTVELESSKSA